VTVDVRVPSIEQVEMELNEKHESQSNQSNLNHSYSCDGYERLHDDQMDKISVSIHFSDYESAFDINSQRDIAAQREDQKKMKISLSQEQLRLNKNLLTVPIVTRKSRSASFSAADKRDAVKSAMKIASEIPETRQEQQEETVLSDTLVEPRESLKAQKEIKTSSASSLASKATATTQQSTSTASQPFRYPLAFYCKICSEILNDPRVLDCLHSFCLQCLNRHSATNPLQDNQFWRKISANSDTSCKSERVAKVISVLCQI